MKKIYKYYLPAILTLGLASCSVESPFQGEMKEGFGQLSKAALNVEVSGVQNITTRDENSDFLKDFDIVIQTTGNNPVTKLSDKYSNIPDVISLEAGTYKVIATYGENREAEFENPHYSGSSQEFEVKQNEITSDIGKIKCSLANVKVTVKFHPNLIQHMNENAYVEVKVHDGKALNYTLSHSDNEIAGYFKHDEENTLVATFKGFVDGVELNEVKTLNNVNKGNHYKITFIRHEYNNEESGSLSGGVNVDASVTITDLDRDITIAEDEILDDSERPVEGTDQPGGEDPGTDPADPDTPDEPKVLPKIEAQDPIDLDQVNEVDGNSTVIIIFTSSSENGFTKFVADIESNDLTDEDLQQVGLSTHLDLIEPGELKDPLQALGLLKNELGEDVDSLLGQKVVKFDISQFMVALALFPGEHHFIIKVGDDNGESECTLKLKL